MRRFGWCFVVSLVFAFGLSVSARAAGLLDAPLSYTATRTVVIDGKSYTGMMVHEPGRERHEQKLGGMDVDFILDGQSGQGFLVVPSVKTYVTFPFPPMLSALVDAQVEKDPVGAESVDHVPTTKYRIDTTTSDGSHGQGFAWITKRGVLMKLDGVVTASGGHKTKIAMQLANVQEGPQRPEQFAPPSGMSELPFQALAPLLSGLMK